MKIVMTGASGAMGQSSLKEIVNGEMNFDLILPILDTEQDRKIMKSYQTHPKINIVYGDLTDLDFVKSFIKDVDLVIHIAAFVSPAADYFPEKAMQINYGSMRNLVDSIYHWGQEKTTKLVGIGTIAETGDRMPGHSLGTSWRPD